MKHMTIDGISCEFDSERNVLEVAMANHIDIPHLCYCESLSIYGGCRICVVETDKGAVETACSLLPRDGMEIRTNTPKLRKHRQMILELMLASHRAECTTCESSGKCRLLSYARRYGVNKVRFSNDYSKVRPDTSSPAIVRDPSKCILCGSCVRMCSEVQGVGALEFAGRGKNTRISCGFGRKLSDSDCVSCGMCAGVCPTGALVIKNEVSAMWDALYDSSRKLAALISPAAGMNTGKLTTALRMLGADYVFNISTAADAAICEIAEELSVTSERPVFTSSCPAWVKHIKNRHPELIPSLSTCLSPMAMMAALVRRQFGDEDLFCAAIMPCAAKKSEAAQKELYKDGERLVDLVLTAEEMRRMLAEAGIDLDRLPESKPDAPFSDYSEAGRCYAATGDISEALRLHTGNPGLKIAYADGLKNADKLLASGCTDYDLVIVNACPGGCGDKAGVCNEPQSKYPAPNDNPSMFFVDELLRFGRKSLLHIEYKE